MARLKTILTLGILGIAGSAAVGQAVTFDNRVVPDAAFNIKGEQVVQRQVGNQVEVDLSWKGEKGITLKHNMGEATAGEKVRGRRDMEVTTEILDEGFKVDFMLNRKPNTNVFCQTVEGGENYDWFYQPALTQEEIDEGATRPDNVVGSYAVYHKTLKNHKLGGANYETGKAFHVYRPQVWEVDNPTTTTQWAELNYTNGQLCVTVDQTYLDNANYPVRVDPTFGYTTIGGSTLGILVDRIYFTAYTATESGTITSISAYNGNGATDDGPMEFGIYDKDSGGSDSHGYLADTGSVSPYDPDSWNTGSLSQAITAQDYLLAFYGEEFAIKWDSATVYSSFVSNAYPGSWTDPINQGDSNDSQFSIYATYTTGGAPAETTTTPNTTISGDTNISGNATIQ